MATCGDNVYYLAFQYAGAGWKVPRQGAWPAAESATSHRTRVADWHTFLIGQW